MKKKKRFDFVIGNPPYQEEAPGKSTSDLPVYHYFMDEAYKISNKVELITPARFLFNAGATPGEWNTKILSDPHFQVLYYNPDTTNLFQNTQIPGGISITYRDTTKEIGPIVQFTPFPELNSIKEKIINSGDPSINILIYSQSHFNLDSLYTDYPQMKDKIGNSGKDKRFRQIVMERFPFLFSDTKKNDTIRILGLIGRKRAYRFIKRKYVEESPWLKSYKVFIPFSNGASGTLCNEPARMISKPVLGYPDDGITQTFIGAGNFKTQQEADNLLAYIKSKFARALLGILKITQGNKAETWKYVPLQDFTANSDIDWSKSIPEIDQQLYRKYGLDEKEIEFIESHVKEME